VLLVQGQSDTLFNLNDATATYRALHRRHVPVGMIWNSGGHGGYSSQPGECEVYDGAARTVRQMDHCYLTRRALGWMNHWLRGTSGGRGPAFTYYRDWVRYDGQGADDEQYGRSSRFPLARRTTFTLSGSDQLAAPGAPVVEGTATFVNPQGGDPSAYSETSNFTGPDASPRADAPPEEVPGQFAAFTSRPFPRSVAAVGVPSARLLISNSNGRDMVFFAKVYDVAPGGDKELIHRLIAPVRVPAGAVGQPVRLKLAGFVHRFAAGHSVQLVLCSTDRTSYNAKVADVLTVDTGAGSTFTLPARTTS
jgi:ABC-2 type transport system ATP-binding protein